MTNSLRNTILVGIALISAAMHSPHFSKDLMSIHVWRQTQTQSTIVNFYEEDMNIFNPRRNDRADTEGIFRMEFPLMQWTVAALYQVFGHHLIITRIFMFILGLLSIFGLYKLLFALFVNKDIALIGAWALNFSPSFYYYTINPIPDNMALCAGIWGLAFFFRWLRNKALLNLILSGAFLAIASLCKLPFIVYFIVPVTYFGALLLQNGAHKQVLSYSLASLSWALLPLAWYISVIPTWADAPILEGFLDSKASTLQLLDYFQHNLLVSLPELLLNYASLPLFLAGFYFLFRRKSFKNLKFIPLLSLSAAVLVFYVIEAGAIAKTHDYYLFPFLPLLFILVAYGAHHLFESSHKFNRYFTLILLVLLPFTCYLRMQVRWNPNSPGFNKDLLEHKVALRNAVPKDALVVAGNDQSHFIFFYYIDKKGWGFQDDGLTAQSLHSMIDKGAEYLYTDSKYVYENPDLAKFLDELILQKGSIRVFSLRQE